MEKNIAEAFDILYNHRAEMEQFIDFYVFKRRNISKETFLDNKADFLTFVNFCLNTARRVRTANIKGGMAYFDKHYPAVKKALDAKNIEQVKSLVYSSPGVAQKIGSMMLEYIYLYSNRKDAEIAKTLFVPLDAHITRLFKDSFGLAAPAAANINSKRFIEFQQSLEQYSGGRPKVYFDYLWIIGKMFCAKTETTERGYRLCNYCWLKQCCTNTGKWI